MKARKFFAVLTMAIFAFAANGNATDDWEKNINNMMGQKVNPQSVVPPKDGAAKNQFDVSVDGDKLRIVMNNPKLVKNGVGKEGFDPATVFFTSNGKEPFCSVSVKGDKTDACVIPNPAIAAGQPYVLNFWGFGKSAKGENGFTMLNPNDPAVSAVMKDGKPDLGTLVVSIVVYPNGKWEWGKQYGNRETLKTGTHAELAKN